MVLIILLILLSQLLNKITQGILSIYNIKSSMSKIITVNAKNIL